MAWDGKQDCEKSGIHGVLGALFATKQSVTQAAIPSSTAAFSPAVSIARQIRTACRSAVSTGLKDPLVSYMRSAAVSETKDSATGMQKPPACLRDLVFIGTSGPLYLAECLPAYLASWALVGLDWVPR